MKYRILTKSQFISLHYFIVTINFSMRHLSLNQLIDSLAELRLGMINALGFG